MLENIKLKKKIELVYKINFKIKYRIISFDKNIDRVSCR